MLTLAHANVNGLVGKDEPINFFFKNRNIDVLFLCETWLANGQRTSLLNTVYAVNAPTQINYLGGRRNPGGLMCMVRPDLKNSIQVLYVHPMARYVLVRIGSLQVASCYLPPSMNHDEAMKILEEIVDKTDQDCVILGDMNARIGSIVGDGIVNIRGRKLLDFMDNSGVFVVPATSKTHTSFNGTGKGVTDLVLSTDNVPEVIIATGETLGGSDHFPMIVNVQCERPPSTIIDRWNVVKLNQPEVQEKYRKLLDESKQETVDAMMGKPVDQQWKLVRDWIDNAAASSCGRFYLRLSRRNEFWNQETIQARADIMRMTSDYALLLDLPNTPPNLKLAMYKMLTKKNAEYRLLLKRRKDELFRAWCETMARPEAGSLFLKTVRCLRSRRDGKHCALDPRELNQHATHFDSTFGGTPSGTLDANQAARLSTLDTIPTSLRFTRSEVSKSIAEVIKGKACGIDDILGEMIVYATKSTMTEILTILFNSINEQGRLPEDWINALVVPIFKNKGSANEVVNYRPISLTSIVRRIFERIVKVRLGPALKLLEFTQGGFRTGRSTLDQAYVLDETLINHPAAFAILLDFKAAYDMVDRRILWAKLLSEYHVQSDLVKVLRLLFDSNSSYLVVAGQRSRPITNTRGLLQGSSLSPILFNFFIDGLLKELNSRNDLKLSTHGMKYNHLAFADDIILLTNTRNVMTSLLNICENWSNMHGMRFAPSKCIELSGETSSLHFKLYGLDIPKEKVTKYLGVYFSAKGIDWSAQLEARRQKLLKTLAIFKHIGYNISGYHQSSSVLIYKSFLRPVLEYGASLGPPAPIIKRYNSCQNLALGAMFSCARNTSKHALNKLTLVEPMHFRIPYLMVKFGAKLHNNIDAAIPAVRLWWYSLNSMHSDSLTKNVIAQPIWLKARRINHFTNRLTPQVPSTFKIQQPFTPTEYSKLKQDSIRSLDPIATSDNVAACVPLPVQHWKLSCWLDASIYPDVPTRINLLRWLTGNVCWHEPCRACAGGNELSRAHAIHCIQQPTKLNALRVLSGLRPTEYPQVNVLSRVILKVSESATPPSHQIMGLLSDVISLIFRKCKGLTQEPNGFWTQPRPSTTQATNTAASASPTATTGTPATTSTTSTNAAVSASVSLTTATTNGTAATATTTATDAALSDTVSAIMATTPTNAAVSATVSAAPATSNATAANPAPVRRWNSGGRDTKLKQAAEKRRRKALTETDDANDGTELIMETAAIAMGSLRGLSAKLKGKSPMELRNAKRTIKNVQVYRNSAPMTGTYHSTPPMRQTQAPSSNALQQSQASIAVPRDTAASSSSDTPGATATTESPATIEGPVSKHAEGGKRKRKPNAESGTSSRKKDGAGNKKKSGAKAKAGNKDKNNTVDDDDGVTRKRKRQETATSFFSRKSIKQEKDPVSDHGDSHSKA